ncbi:MAG: transporter substrate-binding domain-containing protein [Treponema sp.]|nr:transporter substrate-binding domain-containing protein [Treponema sp.]
MKRIASFLLGIVCFSLSACYKPASKDLLDQVKIRGELVIAMEGVWEPWNYHDEHGELVGFDVDVAKEICKRMGLKAKFLEFEWERVLPALEKHECDIVVSGVEVTSDRRANFYFSKPYAFEKTVLIVKKTTDDIKSFDDLRGRTSANSLNSTYDNLAKQYGAIPIAVDTFDETINLLLENRADSTINSILVYYNYMKNNSNVPIKVAAESDNKCQIAIPCRRETENLSLMLEINKALDSMMADGTLSQLSMKYFEQDVTK